MSAVSEVFVTFRQTSFSQTISSVGRTLDVDADADATVDGPATFDSTFVTVDWVNLIPAVTFLIRSFSSWLDAIALVTMSMGVPVEPIKNIEGNGTSLSTIVWC